MDRSARYAIGDHTFLMKHTWGPKYPQPHLLIIYSVVCDLRPCVFKLLTPRHAIVFDLLLSRLALAQRSPGVGMLLLPLVIIDIGRNAHANAELDVY